MAETQAQPLQRITIIGNGAMATACGLLLDGRGCAVTLWGPFPEAITDMARARENQAYLPGIPLTESLALTSEIEAAVESPDLVISAIPTQYIRTTWAGFSGRLRGGVPIVSVAKGIENETLLPPTGIIADVLGADRHPLAALSGPSIASELARCLPATVCVASEDEAVSAAVQRVFTSDTLRVYTNPDLLGVELAGATKNVIALAAGILDGLHAGYNAKSALLSRGLAEIARLGQAMGATQETFFGITGVGDLATTCFCPLGRNRSAGEMLGRGLKLDDVLEQIQGVVEGVPTTKAVMTLAERHGVEMPITAAVHAVLFEQMDPIEGISRLMRREPKAERVG
jgi:glycerol-3-phosphate dehydrogenase (NAD(P)+)